MLYIPTVALALFEWRGFGLFQGIAGTVRCTRALYVRSLANGLSVCFSVRVLCHLRLYLSHCRYLIHAIRDVCRINRTEQDTKSYRTPCIDIFFFLIRDFYPFEGL